MKTCVRRNDSYKKHKKDDKQKHRANSYKMF